MRFQGRVFPKEARHHAFDTPAIEQRRPSFHFFRRRPRAPSVPAGPFGDLVDCLSRSGAIPTTPSHTQGRRLPAGLKRPANHLPSHNASVHQALPVGKRPPSKLPHRDANSVNRPESSADTLLALNEHTAPAVAALTGQQPWSPKPGPAGWLFPISVQPQCPTTVRAAGRPRGPAFPPYRSNSVPGVRCHTRARETGASVPRPLP